MTERRPADVSAHEWQHRLLEERVETFRATPKTQAWRLLRRQNYQRAFVTIDGHMRQFHGYRRITGLPPTLDAMVSLHDKAHAELMEAR